MNREQATQGRKENLRCTFPGDFAVRFVRTLARCEDFGLRWQPAEAKRSEDWSAAATPLFDCGQSSQSGVALRFPPQSKKIWVWFCRVAPLPLCVEFILGSSVRPRSRHDVSSQWPAPNCCFNPVLQSLCKFGQFVGPPNDEIILPRVEVGFLQLIFPAKPDYWQAKSGRKAGFKIDSAAVPREIGNEKLASADTRNNFIVNFVVVLLAVNSEWFVA